jgi:hypothetical protein
LQESASREANTHSASSQWRRKLAVLPAKSSGSRVAGIQKETRKEMKIRRLGVAGGAALLAAALVMPSGSALAADPAPITDQYGGAASSQVLDLHLLGRHVAFGSADVATTLDAVTKQLTAEAKGVGALLSPESVSIARFNDPAATGGKKCGVPGLGTVTDLLGGLTGAQLPISLGGLLPKLEINAACGEANVGGDATSFLAESVGGLLQIKVAMPQILQDALKTVQGLGGGALQGLPIVGALGSPDQAVQGALGQVNGLLGGLLGATGLPVLNAVAPVLSNPQETVTNLLGGIAGGDLIQINLGVSTASNRGDLASYISQAVSEGGSIVVLPNFAGPDKALLKITIARSAAKVAIDRAAAKADPMVENTLIRVESPILGDLGLGSLPIIGGLLGSTGLPVVGSVVPVVEGLLGGIPVADGVLGGLLGFDATVKGLGLKSGPGYMELGPGMSVSILCDGPLALLCSEISVGAVKDPEVLPNGRTHVEASAATIHLLKGLGALSNLPLVGNLPIVGSLNPGTILGNDLLGGLLGPLTGGALNIGEKSDVPGIKISLAQAMAEAGGVKVLGAVEEQARDLPAVAPYQAPALPRTGGLPVSGAAIPALFGASAGLRMIVRRRRNG